MWLCLFTDRDHKSYLYGGRSRDASYQVLIHLAKQFQMRSFIEIYQPETRIAYGGHDDIYFNLTLPLH